jgi:murein DD-endopeptidase MepM/ murein hydrolase activator NlpD
MIWPLENPVITQYFGESYLDYSRWGYPGHNGLDLWTDDCPPVVVCIAAGALLTAGWEPDGYGKYVVVAHPGGWRSTYAHLAHVYLRPGEQVEEGTPVGRMGDTGYTTGPHLHLGVRGAVAANPAYKGYVDPLPMLRGSAPPPDGSARLVDGSWADAPGSAAPPAQPAKPAGDGYQLPISVVVKVSKNKTVYRMRRYY